MWELIIAYAVGDTVEKFTRRSTDDHNWNYDGDGFWSFHCTGITGSTDRWSGTFRNVVWFTETEISNGEGQDQVATAQGEDPVSGWLQD